MLDRRSKRILLILVLIQVLLASLDLIGVLLFGLVAALSASVVSGTEPPVILDALSLFGLEQVNQVYLAIGLAVAAGLVLITKSVVAFLLVRRSLRFLANRQALISSRLAGQLLSRPLLFVQKRSSQQTAYSLTVGVNSATIGILGSAVVISAELAVLVVLAVGLLALDPVVAIFTIVFFGAIGLVLNRALGNWAKRLGVRLSTAEIASTTAVQDAVRTYREVTVTGRRGLFVERFEGLRWEAARVQADSQIMAQVSKYVFEVALIVGAAALAFSQVITREVVAAVAIIAVFLAAASRIMPSLLRLQQASLAIRNASGIAAPTLELNRELSDESQIATVNHLQLNQVMEGMAAGYEGFRGSLEFDRVTLTYPGADRPALFEATVNVPPGDSLALVGPTGAGKSTMADLILGVIQPDTGRVWIGGMPPDSAIERWPGAIAYVPQEIAVLNASIRSNVALGLPEESIDDDLVWDALERAHLASTLRGERDGLDTVVGEHGVRLSGGQRQRLGLARALYTRPRLIVLDEATSALDAETERAVSEALDELEGDVTLVIVAHRLATIRHCTQVAYIEHGSIKALGSFEEVREAQPNFDRQAQLLGL